MGDVKATEILTRTTVPISLVTFVNPSHPKGLGIPKEDLPEPAGRTVEGMNEKRKAEAETLKVVPVERKGVLDNGRKIEGNRYISGKDMARILLKGRFYGIYVQKGDVQKLEFYPTDIPEEAPGLLSADQLTDVICRLSKLDYICVKALWVNPKEYGDVANIVLAPALEPNLIILQQKTMRSDITWMGDIPYILEAPPCN